MGDEGFAAQSGKPAKRFCENVCARRSILVAEIIQNRRAFTFIGNGLHGRRWLMLPVPIRGEKKQGARESEACIKTIALPQHKRPKKNATNVTNVRLFGHLLQIVHGDGERREKWRHTRIRLCRGCRSCTLWERNTSGINSSADDLHLSREMWVNVEPATGSATIEHELTVSASGRLLPPA